ncbi:MAG: mechanosensitive ion channel family protein [Burkholderiales bacterium]|nr:mechanosensitive ion channel family protein [Burkholderiales bacterium]MEB2335496.1 mechanosensitive ion channel family protein [Burkholderiales bacterium]HMM50585.1 mechanosensitive ion channel family protein [Burkholderiaceae bacterium]
MRDRLLELMALIAPYAPEMRVAASIVGVLLMAFVLRHVVNRLLRGYFAGVSGRAPSVEERRRVETVGKVMRRTSSTLIMVVAALVMLRQLGISIAPILGAAGVVGIAVGFGAQSLIKDVFAGFFLLVENQIRVGDVVEIAGKSGVVEQLSLRRTRLRSYDGSVHYISNGLITTVTNMSTEFAFALVDIGVAYREDVDRVFAVMRETAEVLRESPEFGPKILEAIEIAGVEQWAESAVMIRARIRTQPLDQWSVRREYLKRLKAAFERERISIPFPHRTLEIGAGSFVAHACGGADAGVRADRVERAS